MPSAVVIPVLGYPDVAAASRWLCEAFGFEERLRIGDHRIQLHVGDGGAVFVARADSPAEPGSAPLRRPDSVIVRVPDVRAHFERARSAGAAHCAAAGRLPYGERQYTAQDPSGPRVDLLGVHHRCR